MKLISALRSAFFTRLVATCGALATLLVSPALQAKTSGSVAYAPNTQVVQGDMPLASSYILSITSPSTIPTGIYLITLNLGVLQAPTGVSNTTALGFVAAVPPVLTFTGPSQTQNVLIVSTVPIGNWAGSYAYEITTVGWPPGITDPGATINALFSPPANPPALPSIVINQPTNQSVWSMQPGVPLTIPFTFTASTPDGSALLTLTGDAAGANVTFSSGPTGLGTGNATGSGNFTVTAPGTYTVDAETSNANGVASTSVQISVVVAAGPPSVVINTPAPNSTYTMDQGSTLQVPFTFTGTSQYGGVLTLEATLDGNTTNITYTTNNIGQLVATGTGNMTITTGGDHELAVTCIDAYGTAQTSEIITVTVQTPEPPPTVVINTPSPTYTDTLPASGSLNVPFSFTGSSTGGPIIGLTANIGLTGSGTGTSPIIFTTSGMNTTSATGTANLTITAAGTYSLYVSATNAVGTATTTQQFVINPPIVTASTLTVAINKPAPNSTYALSSASGSSVSIPDAFTATSNAAGGVQTISATLNSSPVATTPSSLGTAVATANGTLVISTPGIYTIGVTATDAFGSASTSENITVTAPSPLPAICIVKPNDGATFQITSNTSLWVPATINATINPGGTLKTLTATLNGSPITLNVTGLGTTHAVGTANLQITSNGTYVLTAVTTSATGASATDTNTFKVTGNGGCNNNNNGGYGGYGNNGGYGGSGYGNNNNCNSWGDNDSASCYDTSHYYCNTPPPCNVNWQQSWSCNTTQKGGSTLPVCFQIQYTGSSCATYWNSYFKNNSSDYFGCDSDYRNSWNSYCYVNTLCGNVPPASACVNNHWDTISGCKDSHDTTVKVLCYEVYSNGSCSNPQTVICGSSAGTKSYCISKSDQYQFNCATSSGTHNYRADVYCTQSGSNEPCFLGSLKFCTK